MTLRRLTRNLFLKNVRPEREKERHNENLHIGYFFQKSKYAARAYFHFFASSNIFGLYRNIDFTVSNNPQHLQNYPNIFLNNNNHLYSPNEYMLNF